MKEDLNSEDIKLLCQILKKKNFSDLSDIFRGAKGLIDESSQYGSYWNSTISQYLIFLPLDNYYQAKKLSSGQKKVVLESILELYPLGENEPEVVSVDFRILKTGGSDEIDLFDSEVKIDYETAKEQLEKCNSRIKEKDFSGAITSSNAFLEDVFGDIHIKATGFELKGSGDLREDYKKIKDVLNLSDERFTNDSMKTILRGLSSTIAGIDSISNKMGDKHRVKIKPEKHHAKVCVNAARTICDFLYETYEYQQKKKEELIKELIDILDSNLRLLVERQDLLAEEKIVKHLAKYDVALKNSVKRSIIENYPINSFRQSDIFFAAMNIFLDVLTKKDIDLIYKAHKVNSQACGLNDFLESVISNKPDILNKELKKIVEAGIKSRVIKNIEVNIEDILF